MQSLKFNTPAQQNRKTILCLGAHSDDIEIGCGGSILRLVEEYPGAEFWWVVFSGNEQRQAEALRSADLFLTHASQKNIQVKQFRDGYFPQQWADVKDVFEELKRTVSPDLIFTHYRHDLHQDHRVINELTWNTWRDHLILEYEIPKFDGDLGTPNVFFPLPRRVCQTKSDILCDVFKTQEVKPWFTGETFWALLQIRGIECRAPESLAEAFYGRKLIL
jgi:LmbE family N-acetylglucosaminyl deacetylase